MPPESDISERDSRIKGIITTPGEITEPSDVICTAIAEMCEARGWWFCGTVKEITEGTVLIHQPDARA